jgi:hypothetical protein
MGLKFEQCRDLIQSEKDLDCPVFTWDDEDYGCLRSSSESVRDLGKGGFSLTRVLNLTVRKYDADEIPIFPNNVFPQSQQTIIFDSQPYRIDKVKHDPIGGILRLSCIEITRGI